MFLFRRSENLFDFYCDLVNNQFVTISYWLIRPFAVQNNGISTDSDVNM